jgi:hypothetical protein
LVVEVVLVAPPSWGFLFYLKKIIIIFYNVCAKMVKY